MKIIMCDDEPWALKGIQNIIDWKSYGFSSVKGFLRSGEAWQEILSDPPDVVVTDIRMPGMSGLELLEKAKTHNLQCLFVIVSAYAEFEYAQRALEGHAFAYVLKPFNPEKLKELALRLRREVMRRHCYALTPVMLRESVHILSTGAARDSFGKKVEENPVFHGNYRICAATSVPKGAEDLWFSVYDDLHIAILNGNEDNSLPAFCGLSRAETGGVFKAERVKEALTALYSMRFYGDRGVCTYEASEDSSELFPQDLSGAIQSGNLARMNACLDLYETCVLNRKPMVDTVTMFYNRLLEALTESLPGQSLPADIHGFKSCFQMCNLFYSADFFFSNVRILLEGLFRKQSAGDDRIDSLIKRIVEYVDGHYREHLSLELLAGRFNISLSYLSRQFKAETGISFSQYLTSKRIAYAAYLLEHTRLSMTEISEKAGWQDVSYFSKVFKKHRGISPLNYRKEKQHE